MKSPGNSAPRIAQSKPAQIEVFKSEQDIEDLGASYQSVKKEANAVVANAKLAAKGGAAFAIEDRWTLSGEVLSQAGK